MTGRVGDTGRFSAGWWVALLTLGLGWRLLRYLLCFPFWGDEAYLNTSILLRGYAGLMQPLDYSQIAPLLFLWIQRTACLAFGGGEYALRGFPLLAGCAALLVFARLAIHTLPPRAGWIAAGIFATSYYLVRHTCESKPYAGDLFAATLLVWAGWRWLEQPSSAQRGLTAAALAGPLVWLSYPAVFVAGAIGIVLPARLLTKPQRRAAVLCAAYALALVLSFAAFYALFVSAHAQRAAGSWLEDYWRESFPPSGVAPTLWWLLKVHTGRMLAYPVGGPNFGSTVTAVLCLIGFVWLLRQRRLALAALLLVPAFLTLIAAAIHRYPYGGSARVSIHLAPAICLLAGAGIGALIEYLPRERGRAAATGAVVILLAILPIGGAVRDVLRPYKTPEDAAMRRVMADVAASIQPGDQVVILNPVQGTHGPPDGPAFHQSLRYYLELYAGMRPRWLEQSGLGPDADLLLVYHGPHDGPTYERVVEVTRQAGMRIVSSRDYPLSNRSAAALTVYSCSPAP